MERSRSSQVEHQLSARLGSVPNCPALPRVEAGPTWPTRGGWNALQPPLRGETQLRLHRPLALLQPWQEIAVLWSPSDLTDLAGRWPVFCCWALANRALDCRALRHPVGSAGRHRAGSLEGGRASCLRQTPPRGEKPSGGGTDSHGGGQALPGLARSQLHRPVVATAVCNTQLVEMTCAHQTSGVGVGRSA